MMSQVTLLSLCGFLIMQSCIVLALPVWTTNGKERIAVFTLFFIALSVILFEIWMIHQSAYGEIYLKDSAYYDMNARALAAHWNGEDILSSEYGLKGFNLNFTTWAANDWLDYSKVFNNWHTLYDIYLGLLYWVAGSEHKYALIGNAVFLASISPLVYVIVLKLFNEKSHALLAASMIIIDPSFSAVGAFILKDSLAVFFFTTFILISVKVFTKKKTILISTIWVILLSLLALVRLPIVIAVYGTLILLLTIKEGRKRVGIFFVAIVIVSSLLLSGVLAKPQTFVSHLHDPAAYPVISVVGKRVGIFHNPGAERKKLADKKELEVSDKAEKSKSEYVKPEKSNSEYVKPEKSNSEYVKPEKSKSEYVKPEKSKSEYVKPEKSKSEYVKPESRLFKIVKSIVLTVAEPFPWVPFKHGFVISFQELFYPGTALWIIGLPLCVYFLVRIRAWSSQAILFIVIMSVTYVILNMIAYGDLSPRHRVFILPVFWILSTGGGLRILNDWPHILFPSKYNDTDST